MSRLIRFAVGTAALALAGQTALAVTTAGWNSAVDGAWTDPTKWNLGSIYPNNNINGVGDTYNAVINASGSPYTVTSSTDITINSLQLNSGAATLSLTGGTFLLPAGVGGNGTISAGTLNLNGGTLTINSALAIDSAFNFGAGTLGGSGVTTISSTGSAYILTNGTRIVRTNLINNGFIRVDSNNAFALSGGTFTNNGTIQINNGTTTALTSLINGGGSFTQSGTLAINALGTVAFNTTGTVNTIFNNGTAIINSGTLAMASGSLIFNGTDTISGAGTALFGVRPVTVNGTLNLAAHTLFANGTFNNAGTVNIANAFDFNGGTLSGAGTYNVLAGGSMNVGVGTSNTVISNVASTLNNAGTINIAANIGTLTLAGGTLNNSGYLNLDSGTSVSGYGVYGYSNSLLRNTGTIVTSGNGMSPNVPMLISGGTLIANAQSTQLGYATTTFAGNSTIAGTGTLSIGGAYGIINTGTLNIAGHMQYNVGTFTNTGGVVNISNLFDLGSGSLNGGTVNILSGARLHVAPIYSSIATASVTGVLNNAGTIDIDAVNGTLTLNAATLNNSSYLNLNGGTYTAAGVYGYSNSLINNTGTIVTTGSLINPAAPILTNGGTILANANITQLGYATTTFAGNSTVAGSGTVIIGNSYGITNTGTLNLVAHTQYGSGSFTNTTGVVNIKGQFDLGGGSINGGTVNVVSGGRLLVALLGSSNANSNFSGVLNNSGTIDIDTSTATLSLNAGTLNNYSYLNLNGGSYSGAGVYGYSSSLLKNFGTLVTSGSLITPSAPLLTDGGTLLANATTTQLGYATTTFANNSTIAGSGTVILGNSYGIANTGTLNLAARTQLSSGTLANSGVVNIANRFDFGGGTLSGGTFNVLSGGSLNVASLGSGTAYANVLATLNNNGTINIDASVGTLNLPGSGTLNNAGYLNLNGGTYTSYGVYGYSNSVLRNTGTIVTSGGALMPAAPILNSGGTIVANAGNTQLGYATTTFAGNSTIAGSGTVTIFSGYGINNTGTLNLAARTQISSGSFTNSGTVNIINRFDFGGGSLSGGTFNVLAGGSLNVASINSGGSVYANLSATLNNAGTINVAASTATLTLSTGTLNNAGYINLNGGTFSSYGIYAFSNALLNNSGTIVTTGGTIQPAAITAYNGGTLIANATLTNLGYATTSFAGNSTIAGTGTVAFGNTYAPTNSGTLSITAHAQLNYGTFTNTGTVHFANAFDLGNGTLANNLVSPNSGTFVIDSSGTLNVGTIGSTLSATLNNFGTINAINGNSLAVRAGTINNNGTINLDAVSGATAIRYFSAGSINNYGTIIANKNTAVFTDLGQLPMRNYGTFVVNSGTVNVSPSLPQVDGDWLSGGWVVNNNATLTFPAGQTFSRNNGTIVLNGANAQMPSINTLTTNNGLFQLLNGRAFVTSNSFTNAGTLGTDASSTFTFNGSFTNTGTVFGNIQNNGGVVLAGASSSGVIEGGQVSVAPNSTPQATSIRDSNVTVGSGAQLSITAGGGTMGTSVVDSLDLSAPNSKLNLNDHDLIVSPASPGVSGALAPESATYTTILGYIRSGYNNGAWNGPGLVTANGNDHHHALGIATGSMLFGGSGTFSGQPVDASDVLVKYTYYGDANLDGHVDAADFVRLSNNFGAVSTGLWTQGDFNYDGKIDAADFVALSNNFGASLTPGGAMEGLSISDFNAMAKSLGFDASQISAWDTRLAAVPEPATAGVIVLTLLGFAQGRTGRRTRRSSRTSADVLRATGRSAA